MTPGWLKRRLPMRGDERGTSLVYALLFTTIIAVVIAAVIGLASTNLRATRALRQQAAEAAAADGAAKVAINTLRVGDYNGSGAQTIAAFVLRAWRIAVVPLVIYVLAIWGVGLAGGYLVAFDVFGLTPPGLLGALGFWSAATAGLVVAGGGMCLFLAAMLRRQRKAA